MFEQKSAASLFTSKQFYACREQFDAHISALLRCFLGQSLPPCICNDSHFYIIIFVEKKLGLKWISKRYAILFAFITFISSEIQTEKNKSNAVKVFEQVSKRGSESDSAPGPDYYLP